ncbi:hypothetical protein SARC_10313 [Sphaeroforma arctica JP610]|uniref:Uncharacterized protein n=1 Tax=Sphaeroforma arctica JP610 TaxID=667725 RepID=A0A0L0FKB9_9EUKA|nr:hypothetical protein SARC_10313 [Sphaeroforma arctica JP610]KNC77219.1 hypothetical protein SARC_10313 [Sphaeroforma arctica JP610]|eukprot:XP_014151121.1 hypothetical protein SARC_10313 [Sphaeroforma arctica JP610]
MLLSSTLDVGEGDRPHSAMGKEKGLSSAPKGAIDIAESAELKPTRTRTGQSSSSGGAGKSNKNSLAPPSGEQKRTSWGSDFRKSVVQRVPQKLRKKKELRDVVVYERAWPVDRARMEKGKGLESVEILMVLDKPEAAKSLGTTAERTRLCSEYSSKLKVSRDEFFKNMVKSEFAFSKDVIYLDQKLKLKCRHNKKRLWKKMKEEGKKPSEIRERVMQEKAYLIVESKTSVKHKREANLLKQLMEEKEHYSDRKAAALELEDRISIIELQNLQAKDFGVRTHDHYKELLMASQKERRFVIRAHYRAIEKEVEIDIKRINDRREKRAKTAKRAKKKAEAKKKKAQKQLGKDKRTETKALDLADVVNTSGEDEDDDEDEVDQGPSSKHTRQPESKLTPVATLDQNSSINSYTPAAKNLQPRYTTVPDTHPRPGANGLAPKPSRAKPRGDVQSQTVPRNALIIQKSSNLPGSSGGSANAGLIIDPKGVVIDNKGVHPMPRVSGGIIQTGLVPGQQIRKANTGRLTAGPPGQLNRSPTSGPQGQLSRSPASGPVPQARSRGRGDGGDGARLRMATSSAISFPAEKVRDGDVKLRHVASTASGASSTSSRIQSSELENQTSDRSIASQKRTPGRGGTKLPPPDSNQFVPPVRPRVSSQEIK